MKNYEQNLHLQNFNAMTKLFKQGKINIAISSNRRCASKQESHESQGQKRVGM